MTNMNLKTRKSLFASVALMAVMSTPAYSATYVFGGSGNVSQQNWVQQANTTSQIQLDNGTIISFVGESRFRITGPNSVEVSEGSMTVLGNGWSSTQIQGPNGSSVNTNGSGSISVAAGGITGTVFAGQMTVSANGRSENFRPGAAWSAENGDVRRVFANAAQQAAAGVVANLQTGGITAAAQNGIPVVLGRALAALGASGDVIAAANAVDVRINDAFLGAVPTNDVEALLAFSNRLAASLGDGQLFEGSSPALINAYLTFLAEGGAIADFQTAYLAIISQYVELLSQGISPSNFDVVDISSVNAYVNYLQSVGAFTQLADIQQSVLTEYLEFLSGGGVPADFIFSQAQLSDELLAEYTALISNYINFIANGNNPADFTGASADIIQQYLAALDANGVLDTVFAAQAGILRAYLDFLESGGNPSDFTGFANLPIGADLAQAYATAITAFIDFLNDGGIPSQFSGFTEEIFRTYIQALSDAGLLASLLADQREFLLDYLAFLNGGGSFDDFSGLPGTFTDSEQIALVEAFLTFIKAGGLPSNFDQATIAQLERFFNENASLALQREERFTDNGLLNAFFRFAQSADNSGDGYAGLVANGGTVVDSRLAYAANTNEAGSSLNAPPLSGVFVSILDENGAPVDGVFGGISIRGAEVIERQIGTQTSSTRVRPTGFSANGRFIQPGENQAVHFAFAEPLSNVPTNVTINYEIETATRPTFNDGASEPGTFDADIAINYTGTEVRVATEGSVDMPTDTVYTFTTEGGVAAVEDLEPVNFSLSSDATQLALSQNAALSGTGRACLEGETGCRVNFTLFPGGEGATSLAVSYTSQDGGDGSVGFAGAAGFVAVDDDTTTSPPPTTGNTLTDTVFIYALNTESFGGNVTRRAGITAELADDNSLLRIPGATTEGPDNFNVGTSSVEASFNEPGAFYTRFGAGTLQFFGQDLVIGAGNSFNTLILSDLLPTLPVAGTVTYTLTRAADFDFSNDYTGDASLDATLAIAFGPRPRLAIEGILSLDADYGFSSPGGIAGLADSPFTLASNIITLRAPFTSGTGQFCSSLSSCSLTYTGGLNNDASRINGLFAVRSDVASLTGAATFTSDNISSLSFDAGAGVNTGAVTAAYSGSEGVLSLVGAGASNADNRITTTFLSNRLNFDNRGLSSVSFDLTGGGTSLYFDRSDLEVADLAGTADWQIGRFNGGTAEGTLFGQNTPLFGPDNGFSYLVLAPLTNLPTEGTIRYNLASATRPVYGSGLIAPGTFTGDMAVQFGTSVRIGLDARVVMSDATYNFGTIGGVADLSNAPTLRLFDNYATARVTGSNVVFDITGNSAVCPDISTCRPRLDFTLGGDNARYAGLTYNFSTFSGFTNADDLNTTGLSGAAVFEAGDAVAEPTPVEGTVRNNQYVAYAATTIGIDQRDPIPVTYDNATGAPLAYSFDPPNEEPEIGTAQLNEAGSIADVIGWGRWAGGRTAGRYFAITDGIPLPENGGWHLVAGTPATNLPTTGRIDYDLVGSTAPTIRDGSLAPGTVTGSAAVAFGTTPTVGIELDVSIGGNNYGLATTGGVTDPTQGLAVNVSGANNQGIGNMGFRGNVSATGSGPVCGGSGNCSGIFTGFLAGEGASHIGLAYTFGNNSFDQQVDGTVVFGQR